MMMQLSESARCAELDAVIFDLDGVITRTATVHARAWERMFDEYLALRTLRGESRFERFDLHTDYPTLVDGKPRLDGVHDFLASRGIELPRGGPDDSLESATVRGLGNRKNELFLELLAAEGVDVFEDAMELLHRCRASGLRTAVVSSSRNCAHIVEAAGLSELFDARVDGVIAAELRLPGKPAPDIFLEAARRLRVAPGDAAVIEDATAGVRAGSAGGFKLVVGVDRTGTADALRHAGAGVVVSSLRDLVLRARHGKPRPRGPAELPWALEHGGEIAWRASGKRLAVFLDYDGTLTPIVARPELATLSKRVRAVLARLSAHCFTAVVSGRDRNDVQSLVQLDDLVYAGSHGFDIAGPGGLRMENEEGTKHLGTLDAAERALRQRLDAVPGALVERKRFSVAAHYRNVAQQDVERVRGAVDEVLAGVEGLARHGGKKVFELRPDVEWDKGRAVAWLLGAVGLDRDDVLPLYIGDDLTDEDAFRYLAERGTGIGIGVGDLPERTFAQFRLRDPDEVERFLDMLTDVASVQKGSQRDWQLVYEGFEPAKEPLREALCTLGNGYFATRGAAEEADSGGPHYPGTYLAGGYNRVITEVHGRAVENEDLVNWPNWLSLSFRPQDGDWLDLRKLRVEDYRQVLDLHNGILSRTMRVRDSAGRRTRLESRRIVHIRSPHLAAIEWTLTPENWTGSLEISSRLDGGVENSGVERYSDLEGKHFDVEELGRSGEESVYLAVRTRQSRIRMAQAARTRVFGDGAVRAERRVVQGPVSVATLLSVPCRQSQAVHIEKVVAVYTSRDGAISEPILAARKAMLHAPDFEGLLAAHTLAWSRLWHRCDIELGGSAEAQLLSRLHIFHLLQTVSSNSIDLDVGVPSRGLHGEAYRGHIFWDELYIFPFLNRSIPEITRALLMYRFRRLDEARLAAREAGFCGAMYPWQSGSDGREESQVVHLNPQSGRWIPDDTHLQRHVNAAIAYNIWQYYQATEDREFLSFYGAEIFLEVARFWASIATFNEDQDRYEIRGVVGPDEYHTRYPHSETPGLNNNAYTNIMAVWVLRHALRVLDLLTGDRRAEMREKLRLDDVELTRWEEISHKMFVPFHDGGIISQFEGYGDLEELDWEKYRSRYGPSFRLDRILEAEGDTPNRYKAGKQADVLMLFYLFSSDELMEIMSLLGYPFKPELIRKNVDYYIRRTSHGSTLSGLIHSWVLSRSDRERSWSWFEHALKADYNDIQRGTTPEGIHLGAMAGTVDLIERGYVGIEMRNDVLWLNPRLPQELTTVRLRIRYRGHWLRLHASHQKLEVHLETGGYRTIRVGIKGVVRDLDQGESAEANL